MENQKTIWEWARNIWWIAGIVFGFAIGMYIWIVMPLNKIENKIELLSFQVDRIEKWLDEHDKWSDQRVKETDDRYLTLKEEVSKIEYILKIK